MARLHEYQGKAFWLRMDLYFRVVAAPPQLMTLSRRVKEASSQITNFCTSLLRIALRGRGDEFLEARIISQRIEHRIAPEQRRSQQHVYQGALVRYRQ